MQVMVKAFASLREVAERQTEIHVEEGAAVGDLLETLCRRYPGLAEKIFAAPGVPKKYVNVLVNGRSIQFLRGLDTALHDGDLVALFPPAGGG